MRKGLRCCAGGLAALLFALPAWAEAPLPESQPVQTSFPEPQFPAVVLKGYASAVANRSLQTTLLEHDFSTIPTRPWKIVRKWSFEEDSRVGVQMNLDFAAHTGVVVQAVGRHQTEGNSFRSRLALAFLRHDFSPEWTLRVGRLGVDSYLTADSRLVGYSYIPAQPFDQGNAPLPIFHFDGADVQGTALIAWGTLRGKFFAGQLLERTPYGRDALMMDWKNSQLIGGYLDLTRGPWQVRLGHSRVNIKKTTASMSFGLSQPFEQSWIRFNSLALVYDQGPLFLQGMLHHSQKRLAPSTREFGITTSLMAAYRLGEWTPFVGYSRGRFAEDRTGLVLPESMSFLAYFLSGNSDGHQETVFTGVRWDFYPNAALKAQVGFLRDKSYTLPLVGDIGLSGDTRKKTFTLSLDFVF